MAVTADLLLTTVLIISLRKSRTGIKRYLIQARPIYTSLTYPM